MGFDPVVGINHFAQAGEIAQKVFKLSRVLRN
jgi:hypothetical protein